MKLFNVSKLSDRRGEYTLLANCRGCGHTGKLVPAELAARFGADGELEAVRKRLKCSACGGKQMALWADSEYPTTLHRV